MNRTYNIVYAIVLTMGAVLASGIFALGFAAQQPVPRPLPDVLASLTVKELSIDNRGVIEKFIIRSEYFSRTQVPGSPIKPSLKGAIEFDLVRLGDEVVILTHADSLNGKVIYRHLTFKDIVTAIHLASDKQWYQTMPPPAESDISAFTTR